MYLKRLTIIFSIITIVMSIMVICSKGLMNAGYSIIPMMFTIVLTSINKLDDNKKTIFNDKRFFVITLIIIFLITTIITFNSLKFNKNIIMENVDLTGRVLTIGNNTLYIENLYNNKTNIDKVTLRTDKFTKIYKIVDGIKYPAKFSDIEKYDKLSVEFKDYTLTTNPIQTDIEQIMIFKKDKLINEEYINLAYNYLSDKIKEQVINKEQTIITYCSANEGIQIVNDKNNNIANYNDAEILIVEFSLKDNQNKRIAIDFNTKEILGSVK